MTVRTDLDTAGFSSSVPHQICNRLTQHPSGNEALARVEVFGFADRFQLHPGRLQHFYRVSQFFIETSDAQTRNGSPDFAQSLPRSEEHTSELQSRGHLVCRLLLEKKKKNRYKQH